jgi:DNA-binding beta-propeller fold protein YncE
MVVPVWLHWLSLPFWALTVAAAAPAPYRVSTQQVPGSAPAGISMDYIAFDPVNHLLWVPAGNTGSVVAFDTVHHALHLVLGFKTAEMGTGDRKRVVGPSSVAIGPGVVYIGNRGDSSVCIVDPDAFIKRTCHVLDSMPDGLALVNATEELWVTTPRDKSIRILDAKTLEQKAKLTYEGNPEGFAVDRERGRFYTNLEDKDRTLAIDIKTHAVVATWNPKCGEDGPHGLRVDAAAGQLYVACSGKVEVLDAAHDGTILSTLDTGDGVDDLDYAPSTHLLYAGAARAGRLTIAAVDAQGKLTTLATVSVQQGARNPAVTDKGVVFLAHSSLGNLRDLIVVSPPQ